MFSTSPILYPDVTIRSSYSTTRLRNWSNWSRRMHGICLSLLSTKFTKGNGFVSYRAQHSVQIRSTRMGGSRSKLLLHCALDPPILCYSACSRQFEGSRRLWCSWHSLVVIAWYLSFVNITLFSLETTTVEPLGRDYCSYKLRASIMRITCMCHVGRDLASR